MKAPDKVFFPNDINLLTKLSLVIKQKDDVCYIRKDALMEWAKELKHLLKNKTGAQYEGAEVVADGLIDKIESL